MNQNTQPIKRTKKNYLLRSQVWKYFKQVEIDGVLRAKCVYGSCTQTLSIPNWSTSSLIKHLRTVHKVDDLKKSSNGRVATGRVIQKLPKARKKRLDRLALEAIVHDGRSFNDFHRSGLKRFFQYAIPGYIPPHRNTVHNKLQELYAFHYKLMVGKLSNISDIAITTDFWSDKKCKSYLVLTGHFITDDFKSTSMILQFSSFDKRHFSDLIGKEIEKQLTDLNIFHKITTITCDNAPNMLGLFQHLSRADIQHIPCMAHLLHLIVCNGLGIWETTQNYCNEGSIESINNKNEDDFDERLSQSVRTMDIRDVDSIQVQPDNENQPTKEEEETESGDEIIDEEAVPDDKEESELITSNSTDANDVETDEIEDNFQVGLITSEDDDQEEVATTTKREVGRALQKCRQLISTIKNSNVFQLFLKDLIIEFNNTNESKINRSLQLDVKSRWNSTHYMLEAFVIFRPIIDSLFKNIRKMNLSKKQTNSLLKLEISNTCWDVVEQLLKVLEPFRNAIEHISGTQYPTVGLTLFVFRKIQHHFLELSRPDDTELLKNMKEVLHDKLIHYINIYNEGFKTLMVHAYFDPYGFSVLSQKEIGSIERHLKNSIRPLPGEQQPSTKMSSTRKLTPLDKFLNSIDSDNNCEPSSVNKPPAYFLAEETKRYRQLATRFISDVSEDKSALFFWKCNKHLLPGLSTLARKYLATPATSVPSESAFSKSAYYGRKERTNLNGDSFCQSVFLKDKLVSEQ
ncbi:unnamed protein product [Rotaria socialis]